MTYAAGTNATLLGTGTQTIEGGEDSNSVEVVPDTGYRFVAWSDGRTDNPRTDTNLIATLSVVAIIEADSSGSSGSSATRVGDRSKSSLPTISTTTSTPAVSPSDFSLAPVAALIERLRESDKEIKNLPSEEKQKLIASLQAVVVQLRALLASL